jgi:hypothetical protein
METEVMSIEGVTRELLVRYLDTWVPAALQARRATFVQAWSAAADPTEAVEMAEAALRTVGEFADRMRGRRLAFVAVAAVGADLAARLDAVRAELHLPAELAVHTVPGDPAQRLPAALAAAGAAGAPLLAYLDGADPAPIGGAGRPAEVLLLAEAGTWPGQRDGMRTAGFPLTAGVELVDRTGARLAAFATSSVKSLEAFKNALWAVDEYAGVRYRDPGDPAGHLLDISLKPHPGPLRRELLNHLATAGPASVTDLRRFTLTDTVYRAADTAGVLTSLLAAGAVTRDPPRGRLAGDVMITLA